VILEDKESPMKIGAQLRPWLIQEPPLPMDRILAEAAQAGYEGVEIGAHYLDWAHPQVLTSMLAKNGLCLSGVHVGGDIFNPDNVKRVRANMERVAAYTSEVGAPYLLFSGLLLENKTPDQLQSELGAITRAAEIYTRHGVKLLYHNHWWEITNDYADLRFYQEHTDPDDVFFCLDMGWVHRAGGDLLQALELFGPRAPYFHLRDDSPEKRWKPLGQGVLDYPRLLAKVSALDAAWLVVEQDDISGSVLEELRQCRDYLRTWF
jgi:inosose dehydratase